MGGRKFRLDVHRKNEERKKKLKQSNPPEEIKNDITLPTITIPIAAFTTGIVQSLPQLSGRISALLAKSCTWTVASIDPLVLCKLNVQSPNAGIATASVTSTITITSKLHWTISYMSQQVSVNKCPVFRDQPMKVDSVALVQQIMELVDSVKVCIGNPEDHFLDLWHRRVQTLHHSSG